MQLGPSLSLHATRSLAASRSICALYATFRDSGSAPSGRLRTNGQRSTPTCGARARCTGMCLMVRARTLRSYVLLPRLTLLLLLVLLFRPSKLEEPLRSKPASRPRPSLPQPRSGAPLRGGASPLNASRAAASSSGFRPRRRIAKHASWRSPSQSSPAAATWLLALVTGYLGLVAEKTTASADSS